MRPGSISASYLFLRRGDELLLMLRKNTGYFDGWYCVPSGHVEEGELPIDALLRETEEEIGIHLDRVSVRPVHAMFRLKHDATGNRADYFFEVSDWPGDPMNGEPEKCERIEWFSMSKLPENIMPHIQEALQEIARGNIYSELGTDRIVLNPSSKAS